VIVYTSLDDQKSILNAPRDGKDIYTIQNDSKNSTKVSKKTGRKRRPPTLRQQGALRLADCYALANLRVHCGIPRERERWLLVLASALGCGSPGPRAVGKGFIDWPGLDIATLRRAVKKCCLGEIDDDELWAVIQRQQKFIEAHGVRPISYQKCADLLQVTEAERITANLKTILAIDVTSAERTASRIEKQKTRKRAARAASGAKSRELYEKESLTRRAPWLSMGISRSTWYRLKKCGETTATPVKRDLLTGCAALVPKFFCNPSFQTLQGEVGRQGAQQ
jgi:hypothetical protein